MKALLFVRSVVIIFLTVLVTLPLIFILFLGLILGAGRKFVDGVIVFWGRALAFLVFMDVKVKGAQHVPREEGCLYLFSHSSFYDIPVLYGWCPKTFRFGSKQAIFRIPLFGWAMRAVGTLEIARGERDKVIEVYKKAEQRAQNGEAFALAPEGGRRSGTQLQPFKSGPFIFAVNCKIKVVPTVIKGADAVMPNKGLLPGLRQWAHPITLEFLPAVDAGDYTMDNYKELKEKVFQSMKECWDKKQFP